jgi:hypothetical protein
VYVYIATYTHTYIGTYIINALFLIYSLYFTSLTSDSGRRTRISTFSRVAALLSARASASVASRLCCKSSELDFRRPPAVVGRTRSRRSGSYVDWIELSQKTIFTSIISVLWDTFRSLRNHRNVT